MTHRSDDLFDPMRSDAGHASTFAEKMQEQDDIGTVLLREARGCNGTSRAYII
jgi:hypothetical protein